MRVVNSGGVTFSGKIFGHLCSSGAGAGVDLPLILERKPPLDDVDVLEATGVLVAGVGVSEETGGVVVATPDRGFCPGTGEPVAECGGELSGVKVDKFLVL